MASINKLMKQAMKAQQATSGGGAVKVVACCDGSVKSIKLDPETLDPEDVEMLEDMLLTTVNKAIADGQAIQQQEMAKITSGFNMPGLG